MRGLFDMREDLRCDGAIYTVIIHIPDHVQSTPFRFRKSMMPRTCSMFGKRARCAAVRQRPKTRARVHAHGDGM
jgi:hypothetical protein